jgi:hypothetical protein
VRGGEIKPISVRALLNELIPHSQGEPHQQTPPE